MNPFLNGEEDVFIPTQAVFMGVDILNPHNYMIRTLYLLITVQIAPLDCRVVIQKYPPLSVTIHIKLGVVQHLKHGDNLCSVTRSINNGDCAIQL